MTFSKSDAKQRIKVMMVEDLFVADEISEITSEAGLADELGLDSVGFVELATLLSEAYGVEIIDTDMTGGDFANINSIVAFLDRKLTVAA